MVEQTVQILSNERDPDFCFRLVVGAPQRRVLAVAGQREPRMTRMTRMGTGFVMVENLFRGHPPVERPLHRNPFFIRVIREIRGSNYCF
jgi:hypothetical protein